MRNRHLLTIEEFSPGTVAGLGRHPQHRDALVGEPSPDRDALLVHMAQKGPLGDLRPAGQRTGEK